MIFPALYSPISKFCEIFCQSFPDVLYCEKTQGVNAVEIVYQDNRIVVVIKPVGVLSADLPALLRQQLGTDCFRTVHRLDAQVGGLMVLARSVKAASLLSAQIAAHDFEKDYLAVVEGMPPPSGTWVDLLGRDQARRITYVANAPGKDVQEASLDFQVLHSCNGLSLVSVRLHTGRTHQIRVQFASRGYSLWGDRKYGTPQDAPIALWSHRLKFTHPQTGETMEFTSNPPQSFPWSMFP